MNTNVLQKIGLTKKEAATFMALLKLKTSTVSAIAKETMHDRTQTYDLLERLLSKGLCSVVLKNGVKEFSPVHPKQLLADLQDTQTELKQLMPALLAMYGQPADTVSVELFKGKEGITSILKDLIRAHENYDLYGTPQLFEQTLPGFSAQFLRTIARNGIKERILFHKSGKFTKIPGSEYRRISDDAISTTDTIIYANTVVLLIWTSPCYGIRMKSKDLARTHRKHFAYLWKKGKPI